MVAGNYSLESATYASTDLDNIAIDGIGTVGVAFVAFAALIGLVMVWRFMKKRMK